MLKTTQEFLSKEDIVKVREWLKAPGAVLFRRLCNAQVHENQIEATAKFTDERISHVGDGIKAMEKSVNFRRALEVMNHFENIDTPLYTVKITEMP